VHQCDTRERALFRRAPERSAFPDRDVKMQRVPTRRRSRPDRLEGQVLLRLPEAPECQKTAPSQTLASALRDQHWTQCHRSRSDFALHPLLRFFIARPERIFTLCCRRCPAERLTPHPCTLGRRAQAQRKKTRTQIASHFRSAICTSTERSGFGLARRDLFFGSQIG
jgi:hypothetical protein